MLGLDPGSNILSLDLDTLKQKLLRSAWGEGCAAGAGSSRNPHSQAGGGAFRSESPCWIVSTSSMPTGFFSTRWVLVTETLRFLWSADSRMSEESYYPVAANWRASPFGLSGR